MRGEEEEGEREEGGVLTVCNMSESACRAHACTLFGNARRLGPDDGGHRPCTRVQTACALKVSDSKCNQLHDSRSSTHMLHTS